VAHWQVHKKVCARLLLVGKTVRTPWNADVLRSRNSTALMAELVGVLRVRLDTRKQDLKQMLAARELLFCAEAENSIVIRRMRDLIMCVNEWIVSLVQALLFQGLMEKAYGVYVEGCDARNMCANIPGDAEDVHRDCLRADGPGDPGDGQGGWVLRGGAGAGGAGAPGETPAGCNGILLYVAVFNVAQRQIEFCQENSMLTREFYARYLLWRKGFRYVEEYAEQEELHYYNKLDEIRIQNVLEGLNSAHVATNLLCRVFANDARMERMQEEERMVAINMRFKLLCMQGVYNLQRCEVSRVKV